MSVNSITLAYLVFGDTLHVLGAPSDSLRDLRPLGVFTPDWNALDDVRDRIRAQMHHAADSGEIAAAALDEVRRLAAFLFDELVPLDAKRWLRQGEGSLALSLPTELLGVPWELLHTGDDFLSLRWAMGRIVQLPDGTEPNRVLDTTTRSALIIADPDGELDEAYDEGTALNQQLRAEEHLSVAFRAGDVDAAYIRRHARDFDILHYAGHIDAEGWRMSESRFERAAIERLTGGASLPSLVFANGCAGAFVDDLDNAMLPAWLAGGVRHVIGPIFDLPDRLGHLFAIAFYEHLLAGASVGAAIRDARRALAAELGEGTTPWGAYVLYGDPNTTYFPDRVPAERAQTVRPGPTRLRPSEPPGAEAVRRSAVIPTINQPSLRVPRFDPLFSAVVVMMVLLTVISVWLISNSHRAPTFEQAPQSEPAP